MDQRQLFIFFCTKLEVGIYFVKDSTLAGFHGLYGVRFLHTPNGIPDDTLTINLVLLNISL
jgi:hypothetical protein